MKIVLSSNTAWSVFNFREGLILELKAMGFDVVVIAPRDDFSARLADLGCQVVDQAMDNKGTNPLGDFVLFRSFLSIYKKQQPKLVINFTIKPVIYGGLAAQVLGIPYLSVITGLGSVFTEESLVTKVVEVLYRISQRTAGCVFFLNHEDRAVFLARSLLRHPSKQHVLPGSGVNIDFFNTNLLPGEGVNLLHFSPLPAVPSSSKVTFLLSARMIWEKGVGIFVDAARLVKCDHPHTRFKLLGPLGVLNRSAVDKSQMDAWVREGVVEYLGNTSDVRPHLRSCNCVVLPSYYREGVPRSLLEAAAMARPIITADSVGCRDVVEDGINGFLCAPRDVESLANAMRRFLALSQTEAAAMGMAGRAKIEREFDEKIVVGRYLEVIDSVLQAR